MNIQIFKTYTIEQLVSMPIVSPSIQRSIDDNVVQDICNYQLDRLRKTNSFLFLGHLTVGDIGNSMFLLDGQHRYKAMQRIFLKMPNYKVTVLHLTINSDFSLIDAFTLLNKNTPVPDYIIQTTMDESKRAILEDFVKKFTTIYKPYIVKSNRPQRPNINMNHIVDRILASSLINDIPTSDGLIEYIKFLNVTILPSLDPKNVQKCIDKVKDTNNPILYLSCDRDLTFTDYVEEYNKTKNIIQEPDLMIEKTVRKSIPKSIRLELWDKYFTSTTANCPICNSIITIGSMQCGHIVSVANNGSNTITNLLPICSSCNTSMGSENLNIFVKKYYNKDLSLNTDSNSYIIC